MNEQEAVALLSALFDSMYSLLVRYAVRRTRRLDLAEEAVQETFLQLYEGLRRGQKIREPRAWLLCVLRRQIGKMRHAEPATVSYLGADGLEPVDERSEIPRHAAPAFGADDVDPLLALLSEREQEVLLMRVAELKYKDIAGVLGISTQSVSTFLARAIRKLRTAVAGPEGTRRVTNHETTRHRETL